MSKQLVTLELVRMARQQLKDKGESPSDQNIYTLLDLGSMKTINRYNRQLREEELEEALAREAAFPREVRTAFIAAVMQRVAEDTEVITKKQKEAERCQTDAVAREEAGKARIAELEKLLAESQEEKKTMSATLVNQEKDHEVALAGVKATLAGQAELLQAVSEERDQLRTANHDLTDKGIRQEEANRRQAEELNRMRQEKESLERALTEEQKKAAVAGRECELLNKNIEEKNEYLRAQEESLKELRNRVFSRHGDSRKNTGSAEKAPPAPKKGKGGPPDQPRPLS